MERSLKVARSQPPANSLVADLHDRMAVIVTPDKYDVWLDPDVNDFNTIRDILKPYDAKPMRL